MRRRASYRAPIAFAICAALFTVLVAIVDVEAIGPEGTRVGFSHLNGAFFALTGEHLLLYDVSKYAGYVALLIAFAFAVVGVTQLIARKNFMRVDKRIRMLGLIYLVVIFLYVFFEFVVVNYRPVILPSEAAPEASFPSSHTMLACVVCGTAPDAQKKLLRRKRALRQGLSVCAYALMIVVVATRLFSGAHWLTDIVGGALYSLALITLYRALVQRRKR